MGNRLYTGSLLKLSLFMMLSLVNLGLAESEAKRLCVSLGEEFTLYKGWSAVVRGEDYEVELVDFVNSPCPPGVRCIWSGLGVVLRHKYGEEVKKGTNLTMAFGYFIKILDTDYRTYAKLKIYKKAGKSPY